MAGNPDTLRLGPCHIVFAGEDLGYSMDNSVTIKSTMSTLEVVPDQEGQAVKEFVTAQSMTVELSLGDTARENLAKLILGAEESGDAENSLMFCSAIGADLLNLSDELMLIPLDPADPDVYIFPKTTPKVDMELVFSKEAVRTLPVTFVPYPDTLTYQHTEYGTGVMMIVKDRPTTPPPTT
jgi:hypothetical protein